MPRFEAVRNRTPREPRPLTEIVSGRASGPGLGAGHSKAISVPFLGPRSVGGKLRSSVNSLGDAIGQFDAATSGHPAHDRINGAHPTHFERVVRRCQPWLARIGGLRANASRKSHAELNKSTDMDVGDPAEPGGPYAKLKRDRSRLNVPGGCCGTDHRRVEVMARACEPLFGAGTWCILLVGIVERRDPGGARWPTPQCQRRLLEKRQPATHNGTRPAEGRLDSAEGGSRPVGPKERSCTLDIRAATAWDGSWFYCL